ncbi:MAG: Crp/Fnr family transcriptional regulator [Bacteroidota bacterium]
MAPLSDEKWEQLAPLLHIKEYAKGDWLLKEGEICQEVNFLIKGLVRHYYVKEGNELTRQFFFENGFSMDMASAVSQQPSRVNIQTLEDCQILKIPFSVLESLTPLFIIALKDNVVHIANRVAAVFLDSPEEQYLELVRTRPKVIQRVPQFLIASYLGITPEGLSRIKKRIADRERS